MPGRVCACVSACVCEREECAPLSSCLTRQQLPPLSFPTMLLARLWASVPPHAPTRSNHAPSQAFNWTDGRVVFASGSPFPELEHNGIMMHPAQANNA